MEDDDAPAPPRARRTRDIARPGLSSTAIIWLAAGGGGLVLTAMIVAVVMSLPSASTPREPVVIAKKDNKNDVRPIVKPPPEPAPDKIPPPVFNPPIQPPVQPAPPMGEKLGGLVPGALPPPPPPPGVAGKITVDLIPLIDPAQDTVHGRWVIDKNVLHCNDRHLVPRIQIPYQPPEEYDFTVTYSQPALRNGISMIMPKPGGGSCFWYLGPDAGSGYGFFGKLARGNLPGLIAPNQIYTTTVEVRRGRLKGIVNGKVLLDHKTDGRDLTSDRWRALLDTNLMGLACDDPTVFYYVRVTEISGPGKTIR